MYEGFKTSDNYSAAGCVRWNLKLKPVREAGREHTGEDVMIRARKSIVRPLSHFSLHPVQVRQHPLNAASLQFKKLDFISASQVADPLTRMGTQETAECISVNFVQLPTARPSPLHIAHVPQAPPRPQSTSFISASSLLLLAVSYSQRHPLALEAFLLLETHDDEDEERTQPQ